MKQPVEEEIKTLLEQGIITESISEWSSPIVVRRKENYGKYEFTCFPNLAECENGHAQMPYLGHLVKHGTVRSMEIETIQNFPRQETKKQVRGWLGLAGYYRKYIPNYSDVASSLTDLTEGKMNQWKIKWSDECENAFQTLKRALMSKPVLIVPDWIQQFIVQVDECEKALGDGWIRWLKTVKDTNQKFMRWSLLLEEYDYEIEHKSGKMHSNADTLSIIE